MRVRVKYGITGKLRFISHLDLMRAFFRACISGDIPVAVSQGFSPHLKLSFGPPLSVGITSSGEYLDLYLTKTVELQWLKMIFQGRLPRGIEIQDAKEELQGSPSLASILNRAVYSVKVQPVYEIGIGDRIKSYVNPLVKRLEYSSDKLIMDVSIGQNGNIRPIDVLQDLWPEIAIEELKLWKINREELYHN